MKYPRNTIVPTVSPRILKIVAKVGLMNKNTKVNVTNIK
jgi:hypothetical protein